MTTYNTGNPIGSTDPRDLYDNAENLDTAVNDPSRDTWSDRLGRSRKTISGMEREFNTDQASRNNRFNTFIASSGYQFLGDYATGIEITEYNQVVRDADGEFWRLSGQVELPYTTTGAGLPEADALTPLGDAVLRQDLESHNQGAALIGRGVVAVDSIADLLALPEGARRGDLRYLVRGYHAGSDIGGGEFYWDAERPKVDHDGGLIVSPTAGSTDILNVFLRGGNETDPAGQGCFVRRTNRKVFSSWFGLGPSEDVQRTVAHIIESSRDFSHLSFDTPGEYTLTRIGLGSGSFVTVSNIENMTIEFESGVTFKLYGDLTDNYGDGFRFNGARNLHITGKGTIESDYFGAPSTRKEGFLIAILGAENVSVTGLTIGAFADNSASGDIANYGIRIAGVWGANEDNYSGRNITVKDIKVKPGSTGRCIQIETASNVIVTDNNLDSISGPVPSLNSDFGIRLIGNIKNFLVTDNVITISPDARSCRAIEITSGWIASSTVMVEKGKVSNNVIVMPSRNEDPNNKSLKGIQLYSVSRSAFTDNYIWFPDKHPDAEDQLFAFDVNTVNSASCSDIQIYGNTLQARYVYNLQEQSDGLIESLSFYNNKVLKQFPLTGRVVNQLSGASITTNLSGPLTYHHGIITSENVIESGVSSEIYWTKYSSGRMTAIWTDSGTITSTGTDTGATVVTASVPDFIASTALVQVYGTTFGGGVSSIPGGDTRRVRVVGDGMRLINHPAPLRVAVIAEDPIPSGDVRYFVTVAVEGRWY